MNQKYLIALFVFFFFIHVEKTYACHPSGEFGCDVWQNDPCKGRILNVDLFREKTLTITVDAPGRPVDALGHFSIYTDNGDQHEFMDAPQFFNGAHCGHKDDQATPFVMPGWIFPFDAPPNGTWFDVWITIYWDCDVWEVGKPKHCSYHPGVHYRGQAIYPI